MSTGHGNRGGGLGEAVAPQGAVAHPIVVSRPIFLNSPISQVFLKERLISVFNNIRQAKY